MTMHEAIRLTGQKALHRPGMDLVDRLMKQRPGAVIDIGANIGGWFEHWFQNGATEIHAFEPVPQIFEQLEKRWGQDPRVRLNRLAISDTNGAVIGARLCNAFTLSTPEVTGLALALEDTGAFDFQTTTLDDYVGDLCVGESISLIKLDVDGYEPMALRGMESTIAAFKPPIMIELSFLPSRLGENCEAMVRWIYDHGYTLCTMAGEVCEDPVLVLEAYPWRTSFDMVAVPNELLKPDWPRIR